MKKIIFEENDVVYIIGTNSIWCSSVEKKPVVLGSLRVICGEALYAMSGARTNKRGLFNKKYDYIIEWRPASKRKQGNQDAFIEWKNK